MPRISKPRTASKPTPAVRHAAPKPKRATRQNGKGKRAVHVSSAVHYASSRSSRSSSCTVDDDEVVVLSAHHGVADEQTPSTRTTTTTAGRASTATSTAAEAAGTRHTAPNAPSRVTPKRLTTSSRRHSSLDDIRLSLEDGQLHHVSDDDDDREGGDAAATGTNGLHTTYSHAAVHARTYTLFTSLLGLDVSAQDYFRNGFLQTLDDGTSPNDDKVFAREALSLSVPADVPQKRSRSGSRCGLPGTSTTPGRSPTQSQRPHHPNDGEHLLDPAATSLYRFDRAHTSRSPTPASHDGTRDSPPSSSATRTWQAFLQRQVQACYDCEDIIEAAHRHEETLSECRVSHAAQAVYRSQHPPPPRDALSLQTGKRRRPEDEDTSRGMGEVNRVAAPQSGSRNAFDAMAANARAQAQHREGIAQRKKAAAGNAEKSESSAMTHPEDGLSAREAALQGLQQRLQQTYRDHWKRRQTAANEEDAARGLRRLQERSWLVEDSLAYAHQLLAFQSAADTFASSSESSATVAASAHASASSTSSPADTSAVSATTATTIGSVVFGDSAAPLYGRYPPPLFRTSAFAAQTVRLLKWLRTWRRQDQAEAGAGGASARRHRHHTRRASTPKATKTVSNRHVKTDPREAAASLSVVQMSVQSSPQVSTTVVAANSVAAVRAEDKKQVKKQAFLSFFGAAAKVVKVEADSKEPKEAATTTTAAAAAAAAQEIGAPATPSVTVTAPSATQMPGTPAAAAAPVASDAPQPITGAADAQALYRRRWHQAVRHSSFFTAPPALTTTSPLSPPDAIHGQAASTTSAPPSRAVRSLPFFSEMMEEQQDGALLGSTRDFYCDAFGNRLRSARLAQKEIERRVAEDVARRKLEKKKGYFSRDAETRHGGGGVVGEGMVCNGSGLAADGLHALLFSRRVQERKRRKQQRRKRRRDACRGFDDEDDASSGTRSDGSSRTHSSSASSARSSSATESGLSRTTSSHRSHSPSSMCTVSSASSSFSVRSSTSTSAASSTSSHRGGQAHRRGDVKRAGRPRGRKPSHTSGVTSRKSRHAATGSTAARPKTSTQEAPAGGDDDITNIAVVSGPSGSGKTASVYLAAQLLGYRVVEMNASVKRSAKNVEHLLAELTRSHRLSGLQQGRAAVTVEEELSRLKREHELLVEKLKAEEAAAEEEAERKRREARRANGISATAVAAFFRSATPKNVSDSADVTEVVQVEDNTPERTTAGNGAAASGPAEVPSSPLTTRSPASGVQPARPSLGHGNSSQPTAGTLLLFEDADVLLDDESFKPFYAAIRDLAHKSKVPIVVIVTTPASGPQTGHGSGAGGSSRRAAGAQLPLFSPRYPLRVPPFAMESLEVGDACVGGDSRGAADGPATALEVMEEAALRFTDELSSPHFTSSTFTHVPFSGSAAASFFGRQTPFTQFALPSRTALFVQLLLIGAVELRSLEIAPEPATAKAKTLSLAATRTRGGDPPASLTDLCDRLQALTDTAAVAGGDASPCVGDGSASVSLRVSSGQGEVRIRTERMPLVCELATRLRHAIFGLARPLEGVAHRCHRDDRQGMGVVCDEVVLAEASTTDVRFWLNHLHLLLLTLRGRSSAAPATAIADVGTPDERAGNTAGSPVLVSDCEAMSAWDQQRGRYYNCLVTNDAMCPRQRCWELGALLDYDEDVHHELATVHHPTLAVDYAQPSVFELAAATATQARAKGRNARGRPTSSPNRRNATEGKPTKPASAATDCDNRKDGEDGDDVDLVAAPRCAAKRGRGRPPSTCAAVATATVASTPSSCSGSSTAAAAKSGIWSLFSTQSGGMGHVLSPPPCSLRRTEDSEGKGRARPRDGKSSSDAIAATVGASSSPTAPPLSTHDGPGAPTGFASLPPSLFNECADGFSPLPVELVLPYGPTQRRLFPSHVVPDTVPVGLADEHDEKTRLRRWRALVEARPRGASVRGLTPAGAVAAESVLGQTSLTPFVRGAGTQETSVVQRMAALKRVWRRPRKAEAAKTLIPGHGTDVLEDYVGFVDALTGSDTR